MKLSWTSFAAGLVVGVVATMFAADAFLRAPASESLITTQQLVFCVQGSVPCQEVGGLAEGTRLELDSKEVATLRFRVAGPLVHGSVGPAPSTEAAPIELRRRQQ